MTGLWSRNWNNGPEKCLKCYKYKNSALIGQVSGSSGDASIEIKVGWCDLIFLKWHSCSDKLFGILDLSNSGKQMS